MNGTAQIIRCRRCNRQLHTPTARAAGIGNRCAAIEAAYAGLDARQQDKARELAEDGGIFATSHVGVAQVVSEDGTEVYLTSVTGHCTCPWGARRTSATVKTCFHVGAVKLAFAPRRRPARAQFILAA
jgi:uncharacterized protein DUF6011